MDRTTIAQMTVMLVFLALAPAFVPVEGRAAPDDPLGRGGFIYQWRLDRALAQRDEAERVGLTRFRGIVGPSRMAQVLALVDRIRTESPPGEVVDVYARGMSRNDVWMLAYDLYPHRVLGNMRPNGTTARDEVPDGVEWAITLGPKGAEGLTLERRF